MSEPWVELEIPVQPSMDEMRTQNMTYRDLFWCLGGLFCAIVGLGWWALGWYVLVAISTLMIIASIMHQKARWLGMSAMMGLGISLGFSILQVYAHQHEWEEEYGHVFKVFSDHQSKVRHVVESAGVENISELPKNEQFKVCQLQERQAEQLENLRPDSMLSSPMARLLAQGTRSVASKNCAEVFNPSYLKENRSNAKIQQEEILQRPFMNPLESSIQMSQWLVWDQVGSIRALDFCQIAAVDAQKTCKLLSDIEFRSSEPLKIWEALEKKAIADGVVLKMKPEIQDILNKKEGVNRE